MWCYSPSAAESESDVQTSSRWDNYYYYDLTILVDHSKSIELQAYRYLLDSFQWGPWLYQSESSRAAAVVERLYIQLPCTGSAVDATVCTWRILSDCTAVLLYCCRTAVLFLYCSCTVTYYWLLTLLMWYCDSGIRGDILISNALLTLTTYPYSLVGTPQNTP